MPVREEVVSWLEEGKADLRHERRSLEIGDYNWACFAAQQAAEKALKSYIYVFRPHAPFPHQELVERGPLHLQRSYRVLQQPHRAPVIRGLDADERYGPREPAQIEGVLQDVVGSYGFFPEDG
jgi:hypothetical protein